MKKIFLPLIIVLAMVFIMIPATSHEAAANELGFFYGMGTPNGLVENTQMGFCTSFYGNFGTTHQLFFYYEDTQGNRTRVAAKDLKSSNTNVVQVSQSQYNGDMTEVKVVGTGTAKIEFTRGGQAYSIDVFAELPAVGCYSNTTASVNTHISTFKVTDNAKRFYVVAKGDWSIDAVNLPTPMSDFAQVSIDASRKFATITITGTPNIIYNDGYYLIDCIISEINGMNKGVRMSPEIKLQSSLKALMVSWPDYQGNTTVKPQNPQWWGDVKLEPGCRIEYYFAIIEDGKEIANITDIISSDPSVAKVNKLNNQVLQIETFKTGTAKLTCTYDNKTYSLMVTVNLPDVAIYSDKTPSSSAIIYDGYVVSGVGDELYLIGINGMQINKVELRGGFNNFANVTIDSSKTFATIKLTNLPTTYGLYEVYYEATNAYGKKFNGIEPVGLINGVPRLEFENKDYNQPISFDFLSAIPGGYTQGWINLVDKNGSSVIPLGALKSTNENVVKISSANDSNNPDKIRIDYVDWGNADIVYTDANGKTYKLPVSMDFNGMGLGLFTGDQFKQDDFIYSEFVATSTSNVFYLLSRNGIKLSNLYLTQGSGNFATAEAISDYCVKITITDKIHNYAQYGTSVKLAIECAIIDNGRTETTVFGTEIINKMDEKQDSSTTGTTSTTENTSGMGNSDQQETTKKPEGTEIKPVIKQDATDVTNEDINTLVDAILKDSVTDEIKNTVSNETLNEIKQELEAGKQITTEIKAEVIKEESLSATVVKEIKDKLGENGKVAQFLDLSVLIKSVATDGTEKELGTLNVLSEKITVSLVVPDELIKSGREFYVIRVHEGTAEKLELTKNADGTYSFETDRFSSYALAYDEAVSLSDNSPNGNNIIIWGVIAVAAIAIIASVVIVIIKKRKTK